MASLAAGLLCRHTEPCTPAPPCPWDRLCSHHTAVSQWGCLSQDLSLVSGDAPWLHVHPYTPFLTHFHPLLCTFVRAGWQGRAVPGVCSSPGTRSEFPARRNAYCRRFKSQSKNRHLLHFDFKRSQVPFPNYSALKFQRQGTDRMCINPALFTACNLWCGFCSWCQGVTFQRELNSKH